MKKILLASLVILSSVLSTGCATIMGDSTAPVTVTSSPTGANFTITDDRGTVVASGKTPQTITLPKSDGSYFGKKIYKVKFEKDGKKGTVKIRTEANGWYVGNIVFGSFVGWLLVDPFNGGMYDFHPSNAHFEK